MPVVVTNLNPDSTVTDSVFWTKTGAATLHECIAADNGDTSYVEANGPDGDLVRAGCADLPSPAKTVSLVRVRDVRKKTTADAGRSAFGFYHASLGSGDSGMQDSTTSYATYDFTANRPGGGSWSVAEVNALAVLLKTFDPDGGADAPVRHTHAYLEATWFYPPGGNIFFAFELLAPLLGGGLLVQPGLAGRVAGFLRAATGHRVLDPADFLRDIAAYRYPCSV